MKKKVNINNLPYPCHANWQIKNGNWFSKFLKKEDLKELIEDFNVVKLMCYNIKFK